MSRCHCSEIILLAGEILLAAERLSCGSQDLSRIQGLTWIDRLLRLSASISLDGGNDDLVRQQRSRDIRRHRAVGERLKPQTRVLGFKRTTS